MLLISTTEELRTFCDKIADAPYMTVDTEFMRERTFWSILCLIQVASPEHEAMIDPMAAGIDLSPFYALLTKPDIVKVMHGCRQDIEIFHHEAGIMPNPVYDTQIAAMVCGFGDAVGYETLIRRTINVEIDKSNRFTDWARRPLSDAQLDYALSDVTLLRDAYEVLTKQIEETKRSAWVEEEMADLTDPRHYVQDPNEAWRRFKISDRRPRVFGTLIAVTKWRDEQAQKQNVPRRRILKDDTIRALAQQAPKDKQALSRMRGMPRGFEKSSQAESLLAAIKKGVATPAEDLPPLPELVVNRPGMGALVDLLKVLLKHCSDENEVAPKLIGNVADLERIACDGEPKVASMRGWRFEVFGQHALALKSGKLALSTADDKIVLIER
ncbi:MAG: ribonuclease D [Alphaproteobacteria bacterium]|nr:ribonuclease D [Alphaproteobacteria bacterium]